MKYFYYHCRITLGNISVLETNTQLAQLNSFIDAFGLKDVEIEKSSSDGIDFYVVFIRFKSPSLHKCNHFAEAVMRFALYHGMGFSEEGGS
jgi:hypothetical protein